MAEPLWLTIARRELGVTEKAGKATNTRILDYYRASGAASVTQDETPWCAAFCGYCLEEAGHKGTLSLAARSYLRWGKETKPKLGAIMVFKRGSGWQGHVAFYLSETKTHYTVLGGNQGNSVSIRNYRKDDFLAARWPSTMGNSRTAKTMLIGTASAGGNFVLDQMQEAKVVADSLSEYVEWAMYAAVLLTIACLLLGVYYRWQDMQEKGR